MPPQNVYAKLLLLSAGRGYPLWIPEPSHELLMQRREGLAIGDVGVVLDDGGFDVFFNICLPPDHPFHLRYGVPQGFNCIHPSELDIRTIVDAEPPGHVISSSSIIRQTFGSSSDVSDRHRLDTLPYIFNLSSSEGALLVLPKGAERCDLLNEDLFLEQATRHATDWYDYAVNRRRRIINPDSLYLITGIHKTFAWSVAAFENATGNDHTAHFKQMEGNDHAPMYRWETTTCALDWRVGPCINCDNPNQSVFIRGFKIAIRSGFLGTRRVSVEADAPSVRSDRPKWRGVAPSNSSIRGGLTGFMGLFSSSTGKNVFQTSMRSEKTVNATEERLQSDQGGYDGTQVEIQRIPGVAPPLHPSDVINRYLLEKNPSANTAITHDSHWISILEDDSLTQEFGNESLLETVLSQNYHMVPREGVVYLERKCSQSTARSTTEKDPEATTKAQSSASHAHDLEEDEDTPLMDTKMGFVSSSDDGASIRDGADVLDQRFMLPVSLPNTPNHPSGSDTTQYPELPMPLGTHFTRASNPAKDTAKRQYDGRSSMSAPEIRSEVPPYQPVSHSVPSEQNMNIPVTGNPSSSDLFMHASYAPNNSWSNYPPPDASFAGDRRGLLQGDHNLGQTHFSGFSFIPPARGAMNFAMGMEVGPLLDQAFPVVQRPTFQHHSPHSVGWTQTRSSHQQSIWALPEHTAGRQDGGRSSMSAPGTRSEVHSFQPVSHSGNAGHRGAVQTGHPQPVPAPVGHNDPINAPVTTSPTRSRGEWWTDPPTFQCQWVTHGTQCGVVVAGDRRSVTVHLRDRHGDFSSDSTTIACRWARCTASMQRRNITRHILAFHLEVKVACPDCGMLLNRADADKKHQQSCRKALAAEGDEGGYY